MRILYDYQIFSLQKYGGISRYHYELFDTLRKQPDADVTAGLLFSDNYYMQRNKDLLYTGLLNKFQFRGKARLIETLNKQYLMRLLDKQAFDVFHPTYYSPYFLDHLQGKPFVITIHDMIHEIFPEMFGPHDRVSEMKRYLAERADRIIAVSEQTKRDVMRIYHITEDKVTVVHQAGSLPDHMTPDAECMQLPERYILFVGNRRGYKNFDAMMKAVSPLLKASSLHVVCAGGGPFEPEEEHLLDRLAVRNRVLQCNITDEMLGALYRKAALFCFPSLYEGFGIPIVEAYTCGCPVALARASCFPEIAGEAAAYFDPLDESSIAETVQRILSDTEYRQDLIARGYGRARLYTWDRTAAGTYHVYESVLSKGSLHGYGQAI